MRLPAGMTSAGVTWNTIAFGEVGPGVPLGELGVKVMPPGQSFVTLPKKPITAPSSTQVPGSRLKQLPPGHCALEVQP